MKDKNPLYLVKGKDVMEVKSIFDLVVQKFNLEPVITILKNMFQMLLEQVKNFAMLSAVKEFMDDVMAKVLLLGKGLGLKT